MLRKVAVGAAFVAVANQNAVKAGMRGGAARGRAANNEGFNKSNLLNKRKAEEMDNQENVNPNQRAAPKANAHHKKTSENANVEKIPEQIIGNKRKADEISDIQQQEQQGNMEDITSEDVLPEDMQGMTEVNADGEKKVQEPAKKKRKFIQPEQEFICPMTKRAMKFPTKICKPLAEGDIEEDRICRFYEEDWIRVWAEERKTYPDNKEIALTIEEVEKQLKDYATENEQKQRKIERWAEKNEYEWEVPAARPPKDTEFEDTKAALTAQAGNKDEANTPILSTYGVDVIEKNSLTDKRDVELVPGITYAEVTDAAEFTAFPAFMDSENPDLNDPNDDKQGHHYSLADLQSMAHTIPRYEDMAGDLKEIVHEDHKGTGKTQRCVVGYDMDDHKMVVAFQGHSNAREWGYDLEAVNEEHFTMNGGNKEKPGNMDTPIVGAPEETANTSHRFENVVVHAHYWQEWKHLKFNGEFTAQGGKQDAGGVRHTLVETWKKHKKFVSANPMNAGKVVPLKVMGMGHGSGGALAQFMVLDMAKDNEDLPFLENASEKINPNKCKNVQCLVDAGEIEFSLITFGAPQVMNETAEQSVIGACLDKDMNGTVSGVRAVRVEMIFDAVPHMAGPKQEMKEENREAGIEKYLFEPVGEVFYLAPAFNQGKAINTAQEYIENFKDPESAVLEIQGMHALETYTLALKGGAEGNQDFMFTTGGQKQPFWALTHSLATDVSEVLMKWIKKHIYDERDPLSKLLGGNNMFNGLSDMLGGKGGKGMGGMQDMMKNMFGGNGGKNPLGNLGNMFGGNGGEGGMGNLDEMLKGLGGHGEF